MPAESSRVRSMNGSLSPDSYESEGQDKQVASVASEERIDLVAQMEH
ncbi:MULTISPECIES: hypothetical protein [unclassified Streptomyces]